MYQRDAYALWSRGNKYCTETIYFTLFENKENLREIEEKTEGNPEAKPEESKKKTRRRKCINVVSNQLIPFMQTHTLHKHARTPHTHTHTLWQGNDTSRTLSPKVSSHLDSSHTHTHTHTNTHIFTELHLHPTPIAHSPTYNAQKQHRNTHKHVNPHTNTSFHKHNCHGGSHSFGVFDVFQRRYFEEFSTLKMTLLKRTLPRRWNLFILNF